MFQEDVMVIIDRLKSGYRFNRFEEKGVMQEFIKAIIRCNSVLMNKAVDNLIRSDPKDSPSVSALMKAYEDLMQHSSVNDYRTVKNADYCDVCDNKGYVVMKEYRDAFLRGQRTANEYIYYPPCPFCDVGRAFAIKGEPYLTKYFDDEAIGKMRMANREKKYLADERAGIEMEGCIG